MCRKILFTTLLLFAGCHLLPAQSVANKPVALPEWVAMIDNPNTNYFEAVNAFDSFWKNRVKPLDEMEEGDEAKEEAREFKRYVKRMTVSERNYFDQLCYHYKRFKRWQQDVLPYVQDSGRILTQEEMTNIWKKQQDELKTQKR